jgi:superfamily II DNA or RNA helicase
VASKHKEAQTFLRKRFFEGLKSFRDFEARTEKLANTKEVGDALEILVEAHLHLDPVLNAKNVWVVGEIPFHVRKSLNLPGDSKGIDGVYEDASGNIIPYQVKYRTDKETLPYGEVSSFLGITEESLKDRVIFTNARNLAADITKRKGLRSFKAAQFHSLTEEDFNRIHAWLSDKKPTFKRWSPQPHQKEAIEKITAALKETDRTTAVMACGTGKTLVALWAAEAQDPKTVLVLVPSLALLSQTLPDWCKQTSWGERFRYLCVCSDASVDRSAKEDEYALKQSDLEFSVTTDAKVVKDFVSDNRSGVNVIFSTYQSAEVVAEGIKGETIDLGIFDEAHKTTGPKEGLFAFGLNDKNLRIKKRLFLTATPRHYKLNKRDIDGDFQVVSMSDETVYGKVSYRLSFSAAVAADIIVPYKVIISISSSEEVNAELLERGSTIVRRNEIQAKWVANQIALKRAIEKTGAAKIITFHSRVKLAKEFAAGGARSIKEHVKGFEVFHVNGEQNAADRKGLLESFRSSAKGIITNARCLTEGVDVPSIDMVAFVDPRQSKIDIAQAAGRSMRKSEATKKKVGYIVVPLFIEKKKGETEDQAFTRTGFDEVAEVLAAMLECDSELVDLIKELQEARGRGSKFNPRLLHEKIGVIGPAIDLGKLTQSIDIEILDRLGVSWDKFFGSLQRFKLETGHCHVPDGFTTSEGLKLGVWVGTQRQRIDILSDEKIRRLDSLGFVWDPREKLWEEGYSYLQEFHKRMGHALVPQLHKEGNFRLGSWVNSQRQRKENLNEDRLKRLEALDFVWIPTDEKWLLGFSALQKYAQREGHCLVPQSHKEGNHRLGAWVRFQRSRKDLLDPSRIKQLESVGFIWLPLDYEWNRHFEALRAFTLREGHCNVPRSHEEGGIKLGNWVNSRRHSKEHLTNQQIEQLNSLGFIWESLSQRLALWIELLTRFYNREGHSVVTQTHVEDGHKLGIWVTGLRTKKSSLKPDLVDRLNRLNFVWDKLPHQWETGYAALERYVQREGHARVPQLFKEGNFRLGRWVVTQRHKREILTQSQISRLDTLGFSWNPFSEQWEEGFEALREFKTSKGHCLVPAKMVTKNGYKLGVWVGLQRAKKTRLQQDRVTRLESLGFSWAPLSDQWEKGFSALREFHGREGHCNVPQRLLLDGLKLGVWVSKQRQKKDSLTPDQVNRLHALGFRWNA